MSTTSDIHQIIRGGPPGALALPGLGELPDTAGGGAPAMNAADVWRILKQRKLTIAVAFIATYLLVVVATVLIWQFAPQYTSEGLLRLDPPLGDILKQDTQIVPKDFMEQQLNTETAGIKSIEFLIDVVGLPTIKATEYYKWYGDSAEECAFALRDDLSASPVRDSSLIKVALACQHKKEATLIVQTVMDRYVNDYRNRSGDAARFNVISLKTALDQVDKELRAKQTEIRNKRRGDSSAIESERLTIANAIAQLNSTKFELLSNISALDAQLETYRGVDPRNLPISAEMRVIVEADPVLRYYRQQVEAYDIEIAAQQLVMGEEHRSVKLAKERRRGFSEKESARRDELILDLRSRQVETLSQQRATYQNMLLEIQNQLSEKQTEQSELDVQLVEFDMLVKDLERLQQEFDDISAARREAEHREDLQKKRLRLTIAAQPRDAIQPSRPNFILYLGGGLVLSLLVGVGLAFVREFADKAVRTPLDVARFGSFSVLGSIPLLDDEEADVNSIEEATRKAPHSLVAEAFRQVRAHLTFSAPADAQRCLLITSPRPGDGKTAAAINLAVTLAQGNQRVLLIDCNFRRPGLKTAFPGSNGEGLSNVLIGQAKLDDVVTRSDVPNLWVMSSGPMPPTPAELLGSAPMRDLIAAAKAKFDRVIFDGPPCLLISDALIVATQVDGVIVVARAVSNSKGVLKRAHDELQRSGARVFGAILNGVQARPGGYFREQYREFYEYTNEETVPRELLEGPKDS